jgi:hypothetical protein
MFTPRAMPAICFIAGDTPTSSHALFAMPLSPFAADIAPHSQQITPCRRRYAKTLSFDIFYAAYFGEKVAPLIARLFILFIAVRMPPPAERFRFAAMAGCRFSRFTLRGGAYAICRKRVRGVR